jgi:ligand-binding sensor domain-containing protein/two-component sensor histidine kinase
LEFLYFWTEFHGMAAPCGNQLSSMLSFRYLFILALLGIFLKAEAQEFSYRSYGVPDGLVQSQVTLLFQDSRGNLWVVTKGGVSRFDGISFLNFPGSEGIFSHPVDGIIETGNGKVWFMDPGGLVCWDGKKMVRFPTDLLKNPRYVKVLYLSGDNIPAVCVFIENSGIEIITFRDGKYTRKTLPVGEFAKVKKQPFLVGYLFDSFNDRILFILNGTGLFSLSDNKTSLLDQAFGDAFGLYSGKDGFIYTWKDNTYYRISGNDIEPVFSPPELFSVDGSYPAVDSSGAVFYQNPIGKLNVYDHGTLFRDGFRFTTISCMLADRENNLWIGTESGLYRLLSRAFVNYIPEKCGLFHSIWSIVEKKEGGIFFLSYPDGLQFYDHGSFHTIHGYEHLNWYDHPNFYMGSIRSRDGTCLFTRNDIGGIWYDGRSFAKIFDKEPPFAVFRFFEDPDNGDLLAGTNRGLIIRQKGKKELFLPIKPGGQTLPNIVALEKDRLGRYWLGGFHGISLLDHGKEIPLPSPDLPFSKGGNALLKDSRGNIWIGNDEGLFLYDYSKFRKAEHPDLSVFVTALALVGDTGLLVGSVNGLGWLDLKKFYEGETVVYHFDKENGFQGIEVGQNGIVRDSKGYYWIPASDRVVRFDPRQFRRKNSSPRTYISSLSILSENMKWELLAENIRLDSTIFLNHDQKNIRFSFIGINMSDPGRVMYQFMLDGYDKGWSNPDKAGSAVYTNLPPGDYTFRIRACNEYRVWNAEPAGLGFRIVPAIYQSWWFWGLCFIVIAAVFIYLGFLINVKKKRTLQEKLEQEKKLAELQLISLKNQIDPHFTFNAMNAIASVVLKEDKEMAYRFFMKLSALIRAILTSGDKLTRTLGEELEFVSNYLEVEKFRFRDRFEYNLDFDPSLNLDMEIPKTVIQTYAENAIKHGLMHKDGPGHLTVKVVDEPDRIDIIVEDDGIGRTKAAEIRSTSTGKGYYILNGYYEYFRTFRKTEIRHQIIDLYDNKNEPAGTRVEVTIAKNK